jgi:hypothetical protein
MVEKAPGKLETVSAASRALYTYQFHRTREKAALHGPEFADDRSGRRTGA